MYLDVYTDLTIRVYIITIYVDLTNFYEDVTSAFSLQLIRCSNILTAFCEIISACIGLTLWSVENKFGPITIAQFAEDILFLSLFLATVHIRSNTHNSIPR